MIHADMFNFAASDELRMDRRRAIVSEHNRPFQRGIVPVGELRCQVHGVAKKGSVSSTRQLTKTNSDDDSFFASVLPFHRHEIVEWEIVGLT